MEDDILGLNLENYIYKTIHIKLATFFGGPLAVVYVLAENFKQLGYPQKVKRTWIIGLILCLLFIGGVFLLQFNFKTPSILPSLICIFIGAAIMQSWQGDDINIHVEKGGHVYSKWRAVLIGIICLVITMIFIVFLYAILSEGFGIHFPDSGNIQIGK